MKKTMLKRSLALGALMAFAITGSALAAEITNIDDFQLNKLVNGTIISDDINIASHNNYLNGIRAGQPDAIIKLDGQSINVDMSLDGTFNNNFTVTGAFSGAFSDAGYGNGSTLYLGKESSNIAIKSTAIGTGFNSNKNEYEGLGAIGLWAYNQNGNTGKNGGKLIVNGDTLDITVHSENGWAYGVLAQNCTTETEAEKATLVINAKDTNIVVTAGVEGDSNGLVAMSQGVLTVNSNLTVNADDAIVARGDAIVRINEDGTHTTKLDGNIDFNYDKKTSGTKVDADVLVNLTGADSYWNGNAKVSWGTGEITPEEKAQVTGLDLILADGAQWNPTAIEDFNEGDSGVTSIAINQLTANEGIINVKDGAKARIGEMLGTGADVNVATLAADQVEIDTKSADTKLRVNAGSDITDQLANGEASVDETAKIVAFGADSESTDYQFTSAESDVAGAMTLQVEDGQVVKGSVKEAVNSSNAGISNMGAIALMTWRQENNDMNKRLGELRDSAGEHGVWVRMTRGEGKYKRIKNQYNSYQIGYDEKLSVNKNWTVGAALTYTDGESSFAQGTGENTHKGLALYGSYLNDNGSFIDLIAKYSRLEHEFDTIGGAGKGDYETNGYSLSAEYGKRFTKDNGLWIEPQVELTYGKVGSADYMTSKGVKVRQDGMDSLVGRLGFALGKDLAKDKGNVYLRASYLYDFDGETDMRFSKDGVSRTMEQDLGGGWWEVGVGANVNLSAASHLYVDVEKTYGGDVATPWQWNAGVRWSF